MPLALSKAKPEKTSQQSDEILKPWRPIFSAWNALVKVKNKVLNLIDINLFGKNLWCFKRVLR